MKTEELILASEQEIRSTFDAIAQRVYSNQSKVIDAFRENRVELRHFAGTTGYGFDDAGRDTFDAVFALSLGAEKALVRPQIVSGTHALSLALYGLCRRGMRLLSITGAPYDTLLSTMLGSDEDNAYPSLRELGVEVELLPLNEGVIDIEGLKADLTVHPDTDVIYIQRSRGYEWRNAITISAMKTAIDAARKAGFKGIILCDNCYGEFVEESEPFAVGVDVAAGSMIKNPGGSLAPTGGYLAGKAKLIDRIQYRLTAPGIGAEEGSWAAGYRDFYQGLFVAPHVVGESLKGMILAAKVFENLGLDVLPKYDTPRADIIQSIRFNDPDALINFCKAVQQSSPVDSHVIPEPWPMPGYQNDIIMAAGAFVQGSSIELSADGPMRPPYIGYMQGGITYEHCRYAITQIVRYLKNEQ